MKEMILILEEKEKATKEKAYIDPVLLAIARGMKKDGFSDEEIARQTNLSVSAVRNVMNMKGF